MDDRLLRRISEKHRLVIGDSIAEYPVKLGQLARALGIGAIKVSNMKAGISGQIAKEGDQYVIRINRNEARERQRFTIAHELAHYLLHRNIIDS
jgi:Zn-dependent peptidase ImmA (M78 family)